MDSIKVRMKDNNMSLILSSFDIAICLKKATPHFSDTVIAESICLAPELKTGQQSDMATDVWALGQLAFQLLCCPTKKDKVLMIQQQKGRNSCENTATDAQI